ncbi:MAG: HD domain-containing protein [Acidobacteria bacterium]|nr:HD domain-containing protein [Acidobacteriota bacterium]
MNPSMAILPRSDRPSDTTFHTISYKEKRRFPRLPLKLMLLVEGQTEEGASFSEETYSLNLSAGGTYFPLSRHVKVGEMLALVLFPPHQPEARIRLEARVVRQEKVHSPFRSAGVAVEFLEPIEWMPKDPLLAIDEYYVERDFTPDELYGEATNYFQHVVQCVREGTRVELERSLMLAQKILESLTTSNALLLKAVNPLSNFSISTHCANVCIIAIQVARMLEWDRERIISLGTAALLHDIGTLHLPDGLMFKKGALTMGEYQELKKRPMYGYQILNGLGPEYHWLATAVSQVHERENGVGYPRGLKGEEIMEEAKVIGLADVYEAFRNPRPYRETLTGYNFFEEYTTQKAQYFASYLIKALMKAFPVCSYNEYVKLNTEEIGRVIETFPEAPFRPKVELLFSPRGERYSHPKLLDLSLTESKYIMEVVRPKR